MKKFNEDLNQKFLLSDYLKMTKSDLGPCGVNDEGRIKRTNYLIEVLGDVTLTKEMYKLFIGQFQTFGGKYNVRTKPTTIKGIYQFVETYPMLSANEIDEIWPRYINDLFEEYNLLMLFSEYLKLCEDPNDAFELFIDFIDEKTIEHNQKYPERPSYYISTGQSVAATFTKQEFLDSIQLAKKLTKK
ncbi:MAG: hypothetical protein E7164_02795 [Firmicutes bacterium]|nr:hypothetical protein [Bacillota bacterium]